MFLFWCVAKEIKKFDREQVNIVFIFVFRKFWHTKWKRILPKHRMCSTSQIFTINMGFSFPDLQLLITELVPTAGFLIITSCPDFSSLSKRQCMKWPHANSPTQLSANQVMCLQSFGTARVWSASCLQCCNNFQWRCYMNTLTKLNAWISRLYFASSTMPGLVLGVQSIL